MHGLQTPAMEHEPISSISFAQTHVGRPAKKSPHVRLEIEATGRLVHAVLVKVKTGPLSAPNWPERVTALPCGTTATAILAPNPLLASTPPSSTPVTPKCATLPRST